MSHKMTSRGNNTPKAVVEKRNKATSTQMEKEWKDSSLYITDLGVIIAMRETGIYKNVYDQYNWYLDQVFKKHSQQFSERIVEINESKQQRLVIYTIQDLVYFQEDNKQKLTGRRGGVYMGFSKGNVKEQFGLSLESLLLFMRASQCYREHRIIYTAVSSKCPIAQLKTRMLSHENRQYLTRVHYKLASVLSEAVEVISKLTNASGARKGSTSNTTKREKSDHQQEKNTNHRFSNIIAIQERNNKSEEEWEKSEEYCLHSEMVEKSRQINLLKCIDVYFQWYMKLISEKHADKFTQRIAEINKESSMVPNGYTITVVDNNVALALLGFQEHYKDALRNRKVCMGFSKREVAGQYGVPLGSLFTFNECARKYSESGIKTFARSRCIVSELTTRMKSTQYRTYQCDFNQNMVQILYKTLEIVSELTLLPSKFDVKLHLQMLRDVEEEEHKTDKKQEKTMNHVKKQETVMDQLPNLENAQKKLKLKISKTDKEWQKSEEYRLDSEMIEKSKQINLLKCIDVYFQWYMKLISEKHADKFTQRIAEINKESSKVPDDGYTISVVDNNVALGLLGFQVHYKDALRNGEVCMGFSKREVDEQYGITVKSLFTFNECARKYSESGIKAFGRSHCIVSELTTRMKSTQYRTYQCDFNQNMVQILYKTLKMVSQLTTPDSEFYVKLQEALHTVGRKRNKAASKQMEKEWQNSSLYLNDLGAIAAMRETGIYKNVYDQYNWYLDQVFKKHSQQFSERIVEINESKQQRLVIYTIQQIVYFQEDNEQKLTGRRGGVYMGFSKGNVKKQFGLSLESLLLFMQGAECYRKHRTIYTAGSSKCLIAQLKTRMLSNENRHYLTRVHYKLASVLSEAVEVISKLTSASGTP